MVAVAKPTKITAQPLQTRMDYIATAQVFINGDHAIAVSSDGSKTYTVEIAGGEATSCECSDRKYRRVYCKHMAAVDDRLVSLPLDGTPEGDELIDALEEVFAPQLPEGVVKFRKVRGQAKLVAVRAKKVEVNVTEPAAAKETAEKPVEPTQPAKPVAPARAIGTIRRTAKLTKQAPKVAQTAKPVPQAPIAPPQAPKIATPAPGTSTQASHDKAALGGTRAFSLLR